LKHFRSQIQIVLVELRIFLEPTISNPYLSKFYKDPKKYALRMQLWLLKQRFRTYVNSLKSILETGRSVLLDRSVFSDWVFAEKNRRDGNISEAGYQHYLNLRSKMLQSLPVPHVVLYLDVSPEECFRRVRTVRQRNCEAEIPLDYFAGLSECYNEFLSKMKNEGSNVVRVDWNSFGRTSDIIERITEQIKRNEHQWNVLDIQSFIYDTKRVRTSMKCAKFDSDWSDEEDSGEEYEDDVEQQEKAAVINAAMKAASKASNECVLESQVGGDSMKRNLIGSTRVQMVQE